MIIGVGKTRLTRSTGLGKENHPANPVHSVVKFVFPKAAAPCRFPKGARPGPYLGSIPQINHKTSRWRKAERRGFRSLKQLQRSCATKPQVATKELPGVNVQKQIEPRRGSDSMVAMPHALSAVYLHLVFSTKERRPWLRDANFRASVHAYLGSVSKQLGCPVLLAGGVEDHVHLLMRFGRTVSQADLGAVLRRKLKWSKRAGGFTLKSGGGGTRWLKLPVDVGNSPNLEPQTETSEKTIRTNDHYNSINEAPYFK